MVLVGLAPQQVGRKFLIPSLMMRNQEVPVEESAQTHPCSEEGPVYHLSRATYRALFCNLAEVHTELARAGDSSSIYRN